MASSVKFVRVPPNSASLAEARQRVFEFFKTACRSIPSIMEIYNLDDVASPSQLRSTVASEIRKNAHLTNFKVRLLRFSYLQILSWNWIVMIMILMLRFVNQFYSILLIPLVTGNNACESVCS